MKQEPIYTITAAVEGPRLFAGRLTEQHFQKNEEGQNIITIIRIPQLAKDRRGIYVTPAGINKQGSGLEIK